MNLKIEIRETIVLGIPVLIGQVGHMMMGVVDSVMVGKVGAAPLAAASLAHGLFILILIFGVGVSMALSPLVAMSLGANDLNKSGAIFRQGLYVNFSLGIVLTAVALFGAEVIYYLDQPAEVVEQAIIYMKTLGFSVIPVMIFQSYKQFIEGLSIVKPAMFIILFANLLNIFANWVFIFGHLGSPAMGLEGAGWATFCTRCIMALIILIYVTLSKRFRPFDPHIHFKEFHLPTIRKILKLGIPSGIQYLFEVGAFVGAAIIIGWLGTKQLAAHQIALNLASISFMFALGISAAAAIRVGKAVGEKNIRATRLAGFSAVVLSAMLMTAFAILFVILNKILPAFYISDREVINIASSLLIIAALFQLADGIQAVGIGILRGIADAKIPMLITFFAYWVIGLPGGYFLGFVLHLGVRGVWLGLLLALFTSALLLSIRFHLKSKQPIKI